MNIKRKLLYLALLAMLGSNAFSQPVYSNKPVKIIVPATAGGSTDVLARVVADKLRNNIEGSNFVIENKPGGTTQIGTEFVSKSDPDGYTLLLSTSLSFTILPNTRKVPYELDNFEIVGGLAEYTAVVLVRSSLGVKNFNELISYAKKNPNKLTWGSGGLSSTGHIHGEQLKKHAEIDITHVPYKGSAEAINALMAGEVDIVIDGTGLNLIETGKILPIITFAPQRHPSLPNIPAITETNIKIELPTVSWSLMAPKGTPNDVIVRLSKTLEKVMSEKDTAEKVLQVSAFAGYVPPNKYRQSLVNARNYYKSLLESINFKQ
jgi:tripartite-type tricarboxylate transporter receptor subunit TctC